MGRARQDGPGQASAVDPAVAGAAFFFAGAAFLAAGRALVFFDAFAFFAIFFLTATA